MELACARWLRAAPRKSRASRLRCRGKVPQEACENRDSKNCPSFAVALNWGIGSSSSNMDVKAFDRLQIVRGRNSSHFGSKYNS